MKGRSSLPPVKATVLDGQPVKPAPSNGSPGRYQTMIPVGGRSDDILDVVDSASDHPNRFVLCTTNKEAAKRIVSALNYEDTERPAYREKS